MSSQTVSVATPQAGDVMWDTSEKVYPEIMANEGDKATVFIHSIPMESSVSLVNLMTATRLQRKGFKLTIILYGPGVLLGAAGRGYPAVGTEGFPGNLSVNKQLKILMDEGATIHACRFAMGGLYGMREDDLIPGIQAFNPLDVLDCALIAWREGQFQLNTWTV